MLDYLLEEQVEPRPTDVRLRGSGPSTRTGRWSWTASDGNGATVQFIGWT